MPSPQIIVVDDDAEVGEFVCEVAADCGFQAASATTHSDFHAVCERTKPRVIVLDLVMPDGDGIELLHKLAEQRSSAHILLLSGFDARVRASAQRVGRELGLEVAGTLQKPIDIAELERRLREAAPRSTEIARADLRRALDREELLLHFQPKIDVETGDLCGAEALVRWDHPQRGFVQPDQFVALFEREGLAGELTESVLEGACRQIGRWKAQGLSLPVAVNLSPRELDDLSLPDRLETLAARRDVAASELVLEITESGAMEDAVRAADILTRLRLKGFGLSLDDFGTGYSSLVWLHRLPFSELKVDRSFVGDLGAAEEAGIIVRAIVELAHNLGLGVCAEGVETQEAWDELRRLRCERFQGYLASRPLPGDELLAWRERWKPARGGGPV